MSNMHFVVMAPSHPAERRPYIKEAASSTYHSHQRTCKHDAASRARLLIRCSDISHEPGRENNIDAAEGEQLRVTGFKRLHYRAGLAQLEHVASAVNTVSRSNSLRCRVRSQ